MQTTTSGPAAQPRVAEESRWTKCPNCGAFIYFKRLERNLKVCPECNYHFRLPIRERLHQLLDEESFTDMSGDLQPVDVLGFVDTKPYPQRLAEARRKSGNREGAIYGTGTIDGLPLVVAGMDFSFIGGSMGGVVGEAITRAAELALSTRTPLLVIAASGGARMQEGCVSLMQMAKTSQAIARLNEEGILYLVLLTDPTYGGVTASFATLGDLLVAEPDTRIGFAGPEVIEQTIRKKLPDGYQTAGFLLDHGLLDLVETRENLRTVLHKVLDFHAAPRYGGSSGGSGSPSGGSGSDRATADALPAAEGQAPITDPAALPARAPWDVVQLARNIERPNTLEYVGFIFDDFEEYHGDRLFEEDAAIVGGPARLGDLSVMVIGHQKGHTTSEMMERNFGMPNPEGYRKALRLMRYAARFGMPIVTLVDTPGAYPGLAGEERGQGIAIARSILEMSRLPVPIVTIVTGEGGSGGALALAVGDRVMMMENSYYSVISPEGCSTILFKSAAAAPRAAEALRVTAPDLLRLGVMDAVVPEPEGGAHTAPAEAAANLKAAIITGLRELLDVPPETLVERRYQRFRRFGAPGQQPVLSQTGESA
ncbi:MAG: acetyl-CoA carboxylase carboxyltransferase subunit alpha [Chloroflexi bacterium]|nr:acetyl-CoA carboxylase carboxyltransferase subunit alpha [Chloroflexota bacterium]